MSGSKNTNNNTFLDFGIEEEVDPKIKFNSLISVTISTIMCLASKCPLPKSNVDTTKLFLSTITDDNGETPRNIKGFLKLLENYPGPYESDGHKETRFEKPPMEKPPVEKKLQLRGEAQPKPCNQIVGPKEGHNAEAHIMAKRNSKIGTRRSERDSKKIPRIVSSKESPSKAVITKLQ